MNQYDTLSFQIQTLALVVQALALIVAAIVLVIYLRQLKAMQRSNLQSLIIQRREMHQLTMRLSDEEVDAMLLHVADHFDVQKYRTEYAGHPRKTKSYLLMKRKYLYLLITTSYQKNDVDPASEAPWIWLKELCRYREFRDVHESQGKYYPTFQKIVDDALRSADTVEVKWAFEEGMPPAPNALVSQLAMLAAHGEVKGDVRTLEDFTVIAKLREAEEG
jgi:hypothetical protein